MAGTFGTRRYLATKSVFNGGRSMKLVGKEPGAATTSA
jgi:hypothetical protein